jgi:MoaA/NifB/PqqE/SkfB family radical SAM enzyme
METPSNVISIYVTDICNHKCVFCSVDTSSNNKDNITTERIFSILEENMNSKYKAIALWGGESTLRKDFFDILKKIKECAYEDIVIETNASNFADRSYLENAIQYGANYFILSIHGADSKVKDAITLKKGSYDKAIAAINNLKQKGMWVRTNTVVNKLNYKQLPQIVKMLTDLKVDHINISGLNIVGNASRNADKVVVSFTEAWDYVKQAFEIVLQSDSRITHDVFPLCVVKGYEDYQLEWRNFKMYFGDNVINDFFKFSNSLKAKGVKCRSCKNLALCGGVIRGYIELNGWEEFGYE